MYAYDGAVCNDMCVEAAMGDWFGFLTNDACLSPFCTM